MKGITGWLDISRDLVARYGTGVLSDPLYGRARLDHYNKVLASPKGSDLPMERLHRSLLKKAIQKFERQIYPDRALRFWNRLRTLVLPDRSIARMQQLHARSTISKLLEREQLQPGIPAQRKAGPSEECKGSQTVLLEKKRNRNNSQYRKNSL